MKRFVEGIDRGQSTLFPASLDDYVSEDNPVRAVDVFVDSLDLDKLGFVGVQPLDTGRPSYHPGTMLKLYIYGYLNRIPSSRRLERECQRNIELIVASLPAGKNVKTRRDDVRTVSGAPRTSAFEARWCWFDLPGGQIVEKKKTRDRSPALGDRSADLQIFGRFLATVHDDVEAHLRAFCQAVVAGLFHRRDMDKHVFAAAIRLDETKALRRVEPLHRPGCHCASPFEWYVSIGDVRLFRNYCFSRLAWQASTLMKGRRHVSLAGRHSSTARLPCRH
jgi:transposase-like protein DUF772